MTAVQKLCIDCGSDNIRLTAWLEWDIEKQEWRLSSLEDIDSYYCLACETESDEYLEVPTCSCGYFKPHVDCAMPYIPFEPSKYRKERWNNVNG